MIVEIPDAPYIRDAEGTGNNTMWGRKGEERKGAGHGEETDD